MIDRSKTGDGGGMERAQQEKVEGQKMRDPGRGKRRRKRVERQKRSEVKVGHSDKTFDKPRDDAKQMDLETLSKQPLVTSTMQVGSAD